MIKLLPGLLIFLVFTASGLHAATLKGIIYDKSDKETLIGATIVDTENRNINAISGLDGSFIIKNITPGAHTFQVSYISYNTQKFTITVSDDNTEMTYNVFMEPAALSLKELEVVGKSDEGSDIHARTVEKTADNVINIISSKSIDLLPDITAAGVLQRVSGVTMQKTSNSGEAQYAIIRGMDKRYNYTLVNGIKIPSPDNKNRYVPMDIFPSELLSRIEVIKALTPDMEGDAIGGVMNLVLKDAPERKLISANFSTGYNQLFLDRPFYKYDIDAVSKKSPAEIHGKDYLATPADLPTDILKFTPVTPLPNITGGFSFGNRFLKKKNLGMIFSGSYQNLHSGANTIFFSPNSQPSEGTEPFKGNKPTFDNIQNRTYSTLERRLGLHTKFDYEFNDKNKLSFYTVYFLLNKFISRHSEGPVINGSGVGNYKVTDRSETNLKRIYNSTLQGTHQITNALKADWSAVYSRAWAAMPDVAQLYVNSTNIDKPILQAMPVYWQHNTDQDLAGYANFTYTLKLPKDNIEFKAGGMYRHKNRENYYNSYTLEPTLINGEPQVYTTLDSAQWEFRPVEGGYGSQVNQNDYNVTENVAGYYGEVKVTHLKHLGVLTGVRIENTSLSYTTPMPVTFEGRQGSQQYIDILPSIHFKYQLRNNENLRLSYFSSISRPGFFEVTPYVITGEYFDEMGNPYLKRTKAKNVDLRYEWYPKSTDQLLVGVFYKAITDPIEYSFVKAGSSKLNLQPQNFGNATNYGFELVYIKYFKNFGISANYTYTKSQITTTKQNYHLDANKNIVSDIINQTRPLQGQADNIANVSLMYKNLEKGLDIQLSCVYTGHLISQVSPYYGLDYWQYPFTSVDLSFEKKLSKRINLSLYGKAKNLLNAKAITRINRENSYYSGTFVLPDQTSPNSIVVQKEEYRPSYLLGLRYSF